MNYNELIDNVMGSNMKDEVKADVCRKLEEARDEKFIYHVQMSKKNFERYFVEILKKPPVNS
jgi:hypothetical protein